jgi:hypothetical protein
MDSSIGQGEGGHGAFLLFLVVHDGDECQVLLYSADVGGGLYREGPQDGEGSDPVAVKGISPSTIEREGGARGSLDQV